MFCNIIAVYDNQNEFLDVHQIVGFYSGILTIVL